jgi:hypothetical protein
LCQLSGATVVFLLTNPHVADATAQSERDAQQRAVEVDDPDQVVRAPLGLDGGRKRRVGRVVVLPACLVEEACAVGHPSLITRTNVAQGSSRAQQQAGLVIICC